MKTNNFNEKKSYVSPQTQIISLTLKDHIAAASSNLGETENDAYTIDEKFAF